MADKSALVGGLSVLADSSLKTDMSAQAFPIAAALDTGLGSALGLGKDLSKAGADALASIGDSLGGEIGSMIGDIVGDVAAVVPVVGPFLKVMASLIGDMFKRPDYAAQCTAFFDAYHPLASGGTLQGLVPADIFARIYNGIGPTGNVPPEVSIIKPTAGMYPSAMGMSLRTVTEGWPIDEYDFDYAGLWSRMGPLMTQAGAGNWRPEYGSAFGFDQKTWKGWNRANFDKALSRGFRKSVDADNVAAAVEWMTSPKAASDWASIPGGGKAKGLPKAWIDRFTKLRRAIQADEKKLGSDGGAAYWIIYIDLFNQAIQRQYLSWPFIEWLLWRRLQDSWSGQAMEFAGADASEAVDSDRLRIAEIRRLFDKIAYVGKAGKPYSPLVTAFGDQPCPSMVMNQIKSLINGWNDTIHPYYAQGQAKLADMETAARAAAVQGVQSRSGAKGVSASTSATGINPLWVLGGSAAFGGLALFALSHMHKDKDWRN